MIVKLPQFSVEESIGKPDKTITAEAWVTVFDKLNADLALAYGKKLTALHFRRRQDHAPDGTIAWWELEFE